MAGCSATAVAPTNRRSESPPGLASSHPGRLIQGNENRQFSQSARPQNLTVTIDALGTTSVEPSAMLIFFDLGPVDACTLPVGAALSRPPDPSLVNTSTVASPLSPATLIVVL